LTAKTSPGAPAGQPHHTAETHGPGRGVAQTLLVLTMLFWAGNWIVGRGLREAIPPLDLAFWRWVVALVCILPFTARGLWRRRGIVKDAWVILTLLGTLGMVTYTLLVYLSLQHTTAINAALIVSSQPVVLVVMAWLVLGQRIVRRQAAGIGISLTGVLLIVTHADMSVLLELRLNPGDLWVLAAMPVWGLYSVLLPRLPGGLTATERITVLVAVGVVIMTPLVAWLGPHGLRPPQGWEILAGVGYVGVFAALLGYLFWNVGVAVVGTAQAGLFLHLVPAFTILLSALLLGEGLQGYHLAGIALIASGLWLTLRK